MTRGEALDTICRSLDILNITIILILMIVLIGAQGFGVAGEGQFESALTREVLQVQRPNEYLQNHLAHQW